ncbi:glycoside hydrolase family 18 protein [Raineyella sp. LH-20]|uniref:glycoside hydrolase family 18 protein n=1 Tax=Raineyella sp. LH-20 TaxID=3081204 RepID=UPI002955B062|nr:glycosyl hydrolase family 18 protein [Raineyella sp. LH-20]WOP17823.1 glycosyl hydrolase family 18 protein [Raineyella sp. LH-20]
MLTSLSISNVFCRRTGAIVAAVALVTGLSAGIAPTAVAAEPDPASATVPYEEVPAPSAPVIGGYLLQGTPNFSTIDMSVVTDFQWAFSTITDPALGDAGGRCTTASQAGIDAVLAQRAKQPDLRVIRSIGGWGARYFSQVARTPESREKFVSSCMDAFITNGVADGFDLDWEFPTAGGMPDIGYDANDRENMNLLVNEFRKQLDAYADANGLNRRDFWMTAALPAGRWQDSGNGVTGAPYDVLKSFDLDFLGKALDSINIMTYEMGTGYVPVSMPNQPLYADPKDTTGDPYNSGDAMIRLFIDQGVAPNKITWGAMFTGGRGFVVGDTTNGGMWQPWTATGCGSGTNAVNWANAQRDDRSVLVYWDDTTKNQWFFDPVQKRVCSAESPQTLALRAQYAKDMGLNGFFSWQLNSTSGSNNAELRSVARVFYPQLVHEPAAPTVTGTPVAVANGVEFNGEVARVTGSSASALTAVINWGDLTRSTATVVPLGNGQFSVRGQHTYAKAGNYTATVATIDPAYINSVTANTQVTVGAVSAQAKCVGSKVHLAV